MKEEIYLMSETMLKKAFMDGWKIGFDKGEQLFAMPHRGMGDIPSIPPSLSLSVWGRKTFAPIVIATKIGSGGGNRTPEQSYQLRPSL